MKQLGNVAKKQKNKQKTKTKNEEIQLVGLYKSVLID